MTTNVLSRTYGQPGTPGNVNVSYLSGLQKGTILDVSVGAPGTGGKGGPAHRTPEMDEGSFVHRGGAGGGRENIPIIEALKAYAESLAGTAHEPIYFEEPGTHEVVWPYDTPTATVVVINPGGGGGGGAGETRQGEDGEDGLLGAAFIFPTCVPTQRR